MVQRIIWAAVVLILAVASVRSAEIQSLGAASECNLKLIGAITKGDAERLSAKLAEWDQGATLCLDSPGGDYNEGLLIIDVIASSFAIRTHVPAGATCDSACALVFLSGNYGGDESDPVIRPWRTISAKAKGVGFHRPYIADKDRLPDSFNKDEFLNAQGAGVSAVANLLKRGETDRERFPTSLLVEALAKKSDELFLIDTIDKLGRWNIGLTDYIVPGEFNAERALQACYNAVAWVRRESSDREADRQAPAEKGRIKGKPYYLFTGLGGIEEGEGGHCYVAAKAKSPDSIYLKLEQQSSDEYDVEFGEIDSGGDQSDLAHGPNPVQSWKLLPPQTKIATLASDRAVTPAIREGRSAAKAVTSASAEMTHAGFVILEGKDADGELIDSHRSESWQSCLTSCKEDRDCKAFTFNAWNDICFRKREPDAARLEPSSVSGLRKSLPTPSLATDAVVIERYRKKAFPDKPFEDLKVSDEPACFAQCETRSKCVAYTFNKRSRRCSLLARASEYFADAESDSGVKRQK